jgi:hypothetical protein
MKAVTWHGKRDVRVDTVPGPTIAGPIDVIVRRITHSCPTSRTPDDIMTPTINGRLLPGHSRAQRRPRGWIFSVVPWRGEFGVDLLMAQGSPCRVEGWGARYAVQPSPHPLTSNHLSVL